MTSFQKGQEKLLAVICALMDSSILRRLTCICTYIKQALAPATNHYLQCILVSSLAVIVEGHSPLEDNIVM